MSAKRNVAVMGAGKIGSCISRLLLVSALLSSMTLLETPGAICEGFWPIALNLRE